MNEPIQDKAPKPPGLLPKHVQSWLIVGLAILMVLIMWLTGSKKPPAISRAGAAVAIPPPLVEVNEGKIAELQNRIEQLQREQLIAQNALTQETRVLASGAGETGPAVAPGTGPATERVEDPIETERKKRGYLSLFASNIALSYRKNPEVGSRNTAELISTNSELGIPGALPPQMEAASLAQVLKAMQAPASSVAPPQMLPLSASRPSATASPAEPEPEKKEVIHPAAASGARATATGKSYVLFEGTILETVLVNRLDGAFTGPIECLVTTDIYSHDRQQLLIPAGTRLLGETRKVEAFATTRLAVVFHRLIMPDGYAVSLDQFKGLNQTGDTGLRDQVNNHYARIFGASLAIGALGAVAEAGTGSVLTQSGTDRLREGFGTSAAQSSAQILDKFLNILPTITIREGHRVKVYLAGDLSLPAYSNHQMPSDL
ncbi:MAG TPA: TrbI/VirB10 family protein [Terriglobales bacterium]|nr:TrbI/VirB10 family protein [Terriglobales bacterium]